MNTHTTNVTTGAIIKTPKARIPIGVPVRDEDGGFLLRIKWKGREETISLEWLVHTWTRMHS